MTQGAVDLEDDSEDGAIEIDDEVGAQLPEVDRTIERAAEPIAGSQGNHMIDNFTMCSSAAAGSVTPKREIVSQSQNSKFNIDI